MHLRQANCGSSSLISPSAMPLKSFLRTASSLFSALDPAGVRWALHWNSFFTICTSQNSFFNSFLNSFLTICKCFLSVSSVFPSWALSSVFPQCFLTCFLKCFPSVSALSFLKCSVSSVAQEGASLLQELTVSFSCPRVPLGLLHVQFQEQVATPTSI